MAAMVAKSPGPSWMAVLMAAEDWGTPPWEIAQDNDRLTWFIRWLEYRKAKSKAEELNRG